MKAGTENKTKLRIAIVLAIVAGLTVAWSLMSGGAPKSGGTPKSAASTDTVSPVKGKAAQVSESLDPRLRLDLLANSEEVRYQGKGKNIFRATQESVAIPEVKVSPLLRKQEEAYIPPPPPPITLVFFGITNSKGEKPKAFLSQGEDVWIAHEGDVVNRHYKIVRILPNAVEVEDLLNNNHQNIPLTQG
jgi:hypothetical protein